MMKEKVCNVYFAGRGEVIMEKNGFVVLAIVFVVVLVQKYVKKISKTSNHERPYTQN